MECFVLSGGSGTRLWPLSRENFPKQFCQLFGDSLQTMTMNRLKAIDKHPWVVTSKKLKSQTESDLKKQGLKNEKVIYESHPRNTAPAIALIVKAMLDLNKSESIIGVFPSDHLVLNELHFSELIKKAESLAKENVVVTLGIKPQYPETGFGYIQVDDNELKQNKFYSGVQKFHEKPHQSLAKEFMIAGNYFWNGGVFIFKASQMADHFAKLCPEIWDVVKTMNYPFEEVDNQYSQLQSISIDYAIMEKLNKSQLVCIPADIGWSDVGSWDAVAGIKNETQGDNQLQVNAKNNFSHGLKNKKYVFVGLDDVVLVDTIDATLVMKKGSGQDIKKVVEAYKADPIIVDHQFEVRPWGMFEILRNENHYKSKVILVHSGSQISYQSHSQREEHWVVTQGVGEVVLNDKIIPVTKGTYIFIPKESKHRIRNTGSLDLEFIEVQIGTYFGEDDIVRYQDDYKRV